MRSRSARSFLRRLPVVLFLAPAWPLLVTAALVADDTPAAAVDPFASLPACDSFTREHPQDNRSYYCFGAVAMQTGQWEEAARRLDAWLVASPDDPRALWSLAFVERSRGTDRVEGLYRAAADALASRDMQQGEVLVLLDLAFFLREQRRLEESQAMLTRAAGSAARLEERIFFLRVQVESASLANQMSEYDRAQQLLNAVETEVFAADRHDLKSKWLSSMGKTFWATRRWTEAQDVYRRQAVLARESNDIGAEVSALYNDTLMWTYLAGSSASPEPVDEATLEAMRAQLRAVIELARTSGSRDVQTAALLQLGRLTGETAADGPEKARQILREALSLAREHRDISNINLALRFLAGSLVTGDQADATGAMRLLDEAESLALRHGLSADLAGARVARAIFSWKIADRPDADPQWKARARETTWPALDAAERLRDQQVDSTVRARSFGRFASSYRLLAGRFLESTPGASPDPDVLADAFRIQERMRSRTLLDELDAGGAASFLAGTGEQADERQQVLRALADVQRQLLGSDLPDAPRAELLRQLERLEQKEAVLRIATSRAQRSFAATRTPSMPPLEQVQATLAGDQALLIFLLGNWEDRLEGGFAGGAWLIVCTRESLHTYRLPDRHELEASMKLLLGLLQSGKALDEGAVSLGHALLQTSLEELPPAITRLIVVPDGALAGLPLDILKTGTEGRFLAERFQISMVSSATLWHRLRQGRPRQVDFPALALADPALESEPGGSPVSSQATALAAAEDAAVTKIAEMRGWALSTGTTLGRLPHARREVEALRRHLGRDSQLLVGGDATEASLKAADLSRYELVHFAVHGLVDDSNPVRSGLLLAPGSREEDGLLQVREIVQLGLDDSLLVLSACRSASGEILEGEGAMGLARAFFVAGARTVVASLWRIRDAQAAALFDAFYRHLAAGESVGAALAFARRDRIRAGAAAADWGGVVVLGDASLTPFPGGVRPPLRWWIWGPLALSLTALLVYLVWKISPVLARKKLPAR